MIEIMKYQNRKLYNRDLCRYVTLSEILELIKDEMDFKVTDKESGEDITDKTTRRAILHYGDISTKMLKELVVRLSWDLTVDFK